MNEKVDSVALREIIDRCLDNSMDGRFTHEERAEFLATGEHLRDALVRLLSESFDEGTTGLAQANADLAAVNARLKKEADSLAHAAQTLADLTRVVGSLDKLIGVAGQVL